MDAAQRVGIQLPRARWSKPSKSNDLAREAVSCNAGLDGGLDGGLVSPLWPLEYGRPGRKAY
jgi:hypothetical protein